MRKIKLIVMVVICGILSLGPSLPSRAMQGEETALVYMVNAEGEIIITGCKSVGRELCIPSLLDGYPVVGIAEGVFRGRADIEKVVIQSGVRYIGEYAFAGCMGLREIELEGGIQYIADNAFYEDASLVEAVLPESIVYVGENAFGNCKALARIGYPQRAHIDKYAFEGSLWQEERDGGKFRIRGSCLIEGRGNEGPIIEIPYGITEIEDCNWRGLAVVDQYYDGSYEQIILPETMVKLGLNCFQKVDVKTIEIPDGVREIPRNAFEHAALEKVELPGELKIIRQGAFYDCTELKTIIIPDSVEIIEEQAFGICIGLSEIIIPDSVSEIGDEAFTDCSNLHDVSFGEGVREVWASLFNYCGNLERVQFPENLEILNGLMWCSGLRRIYIPGKTVEIHDDIFEAYPRWGGSITVYGQKGSRAQEVAEASGIEFVEVESGDEMP